MIEYSRGGIAGSVCGASWFIALNYLKLGRVAEARTLTLNGSFLHQCFNTPIEKIVRMCGPNFNAPIKDYQVPLFCRGFYSARNPQMMEEYLQKGLPKEYQHMMASFVNISSPDNVMNYVGQIGDDWSGSSSKAHQKPSSKSPEGSQIQLIVVDDTNEDQRHSFDIGSSTTLKALFNDYAETRGVSLRSLRFSHDGKTLFLSSVGNKTPEELNMRDQDVITAHDTNASQETISGNHNEKNKSTPKKAKTTKKSSTKAKGKCKKRQSNREESTKTLEEYKAQHSKILSKLHEEVEPRLKEIRTRLNSLDLERQPRKQKKKNKRKMKKTKEIVNYQMLPNPGIGGKAGKPHFIVQVGEVQNLYMTTKPSAMSSRTSQCSTSILDLHGCTREEALIRLNESLKVWVDTAMQGSYPFVIPATIVCGCGNQILSETVQEWIKATRNICNAPKNSIPRNRFSNAVQ